MRRLNIYIKFERLCELFFHCPSLHTAKTNGVRGFVVCAAVASFLPSLPSFTAAL